MPQLAEQSLSFVALQPGAQHPSPLVHALTPTWLQTAEQLEADPTSVSVVHASASSQLVGQWPSQVSLPSMMPLPQLAEQSLSFVALHPGAQQPSPLVHALTPT